MDSGGHGIYSGLRRTHGAAPREFFGTFCALADGPPARWHRPEDANAVFIRSIDGCQSWQRLDRSLDKVDYNFPTSIAVDPQNPDQIFLGLDGSLGVSEDRGVSWRIFDTHLPYINNLKSVTV